MATGKSGSGGSAVLEEATEQREKDEILFPDVEASLTAEELKSLFERSLSEIPKAEDSAHVEEAGVESQPEAEAAPEVKEKKPSTAGRTPTAAKSRRRLLRTAVILLAVGVAVIGLTSYWQNQPRPVPAPKDTNQRQSHEGSTSGAAGAAMPETAFQISPEKQQLIGVQYGTVEYQSVSKSLRAVGRLAYDETKIIRIHPKVDGWVENVYVDFTGKLIKKGQPLISIYSPDLVQTQQEYLLAIKGRKELGESPFGEAVSFSESLVESARRRLELWDISDAQIVELEKRGAPTKAMTLYAPTGGFVMTRNAYPKQHVTPDTEVYSFADLSTVWVIADIYEFEASDIKLGQPATVSIESFPGRTFRGNINYIYPQVDNTTRTLKVRVELPNPDYLLKADMFADVTVDISYGRRLTVPAEAVMDSGSEQRVFVALVDGYLEPRRIQVGAKVDNKYVVLGGLKAGERIVTSGNFLIDSESNLKSAAGGMGMPGMDHGKDSAGGEVEKPAPKQGAAPPSGGEGRRILYWYDPMHPVYKSDQPGKAPDCGMDLVPKYAGGN